VCVCVCVCGLLKKAGHVMAHHLRVCVCVLVCVCMCVCVVVGHQGERAHVISHAKEGQLFN